MKLTSRSELALKAMIELAKVAATDKPDLSANEIAQRCDASTTFLEQVMLTLRREGLIRSRRGRNGGYWLTRHPADISVGEILRVLNGQLGPAPCAGPHRQTCAWCDSPCQLTPMWREVSAAVSTILDSRTLATFIGAPPQTPTRLALSPEAAG